MSCMKESLWLPCLPLETASGVVKRILVTVGDMVDGDDLLMEIGKAQD
jgi:pyruvate/2-oxoglutarate dehydrogenase complex dihydrolipoamide acyltransferase (E2) component